jgi:hypothetical protein
MTVAGMGRAVLDGGSNRAQYKSGRQTKKSERENNSSHETPPILFDTTAKGSLG